MPGQGLTNGCSSRADGLRWWESGAENEAIFLPIPLIWVFILIFGGKLFGKAWFNAVSAITAVVIWGVILSGCNEEPPAKPPVKNRIRVKITLDEQQTAKDSPGEWQGLFSIDSNRELFVPQPPLDLLENADVNRLPDEGRITIRVAAFSSQDEAWIGMLRLFDNEVDTFMVPIQIKRKTWYTLCHKRFKEAGPAKRLAEQLKENGKIKDYLVITLKDPP